VSPAVVRPLYPRDARREPDVVEAPALYPRVAPGVYVAVTRSAVLLTMFDRRLVRVLVDLYSTLEQPVLAQGVPWFLPVPKRAAWRAAATSTLVRLFQLLNVPIPKRGPLPLVALCGKALRVQVGDVTQSRERDPDPADPRGKRKIPVPLPETLIYSVVRRPLERLA